MGRKVFVIGVGMTKFEKPGSQGMGLPGHGPRGRHRRRSPTRASRSRAVEQAAVGYCYGDSTCGQRAVYELGLSGIPIYNVNNNCSTGLDGAVHGQAVRRGRARRVRDGAGLREDGEGVTRHQVHRPHHADGQALQAHGRASAASPRRRARRRCSATPASSTWSATARPPSSSRRSAGRTTSTR